MKQIILLVAIIMFNTSCNTQETKLKRYEVESAIVKYQTTISGKVLGSTISGSGTKSLYFKEWGNIELTEEKNTQTTHSKFFGRENKDIQNTHMMAKLDNGKSYHVDFDKQKIYLRRDMAMEMTKTFHPDQDAGAVGKSMLESMGGKHIGNESILGYDCEVWSVMGGKQWLHKGVMLKLEMTLMGITTITEVTNAQFNKSIADANFKLPNYPTVKEEGFQSDAEYQSDREDVDAQIEEISNMSYDEWKKMALSEKDDEEMQNMSEEELRQTYDMIQKMVKMRQAK